MAFIICIIITAIAIWWFDMTNPNNPEFPNSWNPSDGPESEDELRDNFTPTL